MWAYNITFVKVSEDSYSSIASASKISMLGKTLLKKTVTSAGNAIITPMANLAMSQVTKFV